MSESKRGPAAAWTVFAGSVGQGSCPLYLPRGRPPVDPATGKLIEGDVDAQTMRAFDNLELVLGDAGLTMDHVIKCNVYLTDMADFPAMNGAYARRFDKPYPARTTVAVAGLPLGARVEIELVAKKPRKRRGRKARGNTGDGKRRFRPTTQARKPWGTEHDTLVRVEALSTDNVQLPTVNFTENGIMRFMFIWKPGKGDIKGPCCAEAHQRLTEL